MTSPAGGTQRGGDIRPLLGEVLLAAWEQAADRSWSAQGGALLSAGYPALASADVAALPVAERDRLLLELRRLTFGDTLAAFAMCHSCNQPLEFELADADAAAALSAALAAPAALTVEDWAITCRLANTADIEHAAACADIDAARAVLLERCVTAKAVNGGAVLYRDLPSPVRAQAEAMLAALHEMAELAVSLACPACEHRQTVMVDTSLYLWAETRHAARRLLADVHELAHAHGWPEAAILAMSRPRRQAYLAMVRS
jgi:hypothetical protein